MCESSTEPDVCVRELSLKTFSALSADEIKFLASAGSEYLKELYAAANEEKNERLLGAVAMIASMRSNESDPGMYAILNQAFVNQEWGSW